MDKEKEGRAYTHTILRHLRRLVFVRASQLLHVGARSRKMASSRPNHRDVSFLASSLLRLTGIEQVEEVWGE